jgi:hypothetical protein
MDFRGSTPHRLAELTQRPFAVDGSFDQAAVRQHVDLGAIPNIFKPEATPASHKRGFTHNLDTDKINSYYLS